MANYSQLKAAIADVIKTNGTQAITGQVLQDVLNSMVSVIGVNYTFAGVATPSTNPSTPDQNVVYMASQAGTYTNFGGIELSAGISLLMWNGSWSSQTFFAIDDEPTAGSNNLVKSGGVYDNAVMSYVQVSNPDEVKMRNARYNIDAKSDDGIINITSMPIITPGYYIYDSDIINNIWIHTTGTNTGLIVEYYQLNQNDKIRVNSQYKDENPSAALRLYWVSEKPIFEVTDFTDKMVASRSINSSHTNCVFEFTAPTNGYLVIRRSAAFSIQVCKYSEEYNQIFEYKEESFGKPYLKRGYGIDCDINSETYGQEIALDNNVGCTDYIDVHEYKYLKLRSQQNNLNILKNNIVGNIWYDENKQVIGIQKLYVYDTIQKLSYYFDTVPTGAYYLRITARANTVGVDNNIRINFDFSGYRYLLTEDTNEEKVSRALESLCSINTEESVLVPTSLNAYNAVWQPLPLKFVVSSTRIAFMPEMYFVGGTEIVINFTRTNNRNLRVIQYKDVSLGTAITSLPSEAYITDNTYTASGEISVNLVPACRRVVFAITSGSGGYILPTDISDYITSIKYRKAIDYTASNNDGEDNGQILRQSRFVADEPTILPLTLLHITDIHDDYTSVGRAKEYYQKNVGQIHDILCTGDIPQGTPGDESNENSSISKWKESDFSDMCLFTLGNHDGATLVNDSYDWDGKGKDWDFDNYIAEHITDLGYVMPTGYNVIGNPNYKACYWHKDYANQKIRLVGLDGIHKFDGKVNPETGVIDTSVPYTGTNEQEAWLVSVLNETLDENNTAYGYSVVIACHYPIDAFSGNNEQWSDVAHKFVYNQNGGGGRVMSYKTGAPVNFHLETTTSMEPVAAMRIRNAAGYNNIADIIDNWRSRDGKYVAWLSGHNHRDYMYYPAGYPDMLTIGCDQAGTLRPAHTGVRNNLYFDATAFNLVTIDTQNGLIKLLRSGYTVNYLLNSHVYVCYDYINRKVLNEG